MWIIKIILIGFEKQRNNVIKCENIADPTNISDHHALAIKMHNHYESREKIESPRHFHKFPWHNSVFLSKYNENVLSMMQLFNLKDIRELSIEEKSTYISNKIKELSKLLLKAARKADTLVNKKNSKNSIPKSLWTEELIKVNEAMLK